MKGVFSTMESAFNGGNISDEETATYEDIETGLGLFHALMYCPKAIIQRYQFVAQLLSTESTRTIIQAVVNMFWSGFANDQKSLPLAKEFYTVVANLLELQFGKVLIATGTRAQLQTVLDNDWPFFTNYTDLVRTCLVDSDCDRIADIIKGRTFRT